ncbi:MAG TPA: RnfABCDGE type electron transport complex subunit G [Epulopiscium sp.]|nr:RnfABCDGE type electron transport complex subunit G [Candidatus Epulonipiscium sp.]
MKDIGKMGGILFLIAAICTGLVGFANELTKEPIARQKLEAKNIAMQEVLPIAENFEEAMGNDEIAEVQIGIRKGAPIGYALRVISKGYADPIEIMIGVTNEGIVQGIKILASNETPGLGANASDPNFTDQFKEKDTVLKVLKGNNPGDDEVSAITGATITSEAVTEGVNKAIEYVHSQEGGAQ